MEVGSDIALKGPYWEEATTKLVKVFPVRTNYDVYMLSLAIGIMYDKKIKAFEEESSFKTTVPRATILNHDNGRLDYMFQAVILTTLTENFDEETRLKLAFADNVDFKKIDFLTPFANFGVTILVKYIGNSTLESMDNIKNFLVATVENRNLDIDSLPDDLLLED